MFNFDRFNISFEATVHSIFGGKTCSFFFLSSSFFPNKISPLYKWRFFSRENKCFRHFFSLNCTGKNAAKRSSSVEKVQLVATHFKLKRVRVGGASTKHTVGEHIILRTRTWNPTVGHINVLPRIYTKYQSVCLEVHIYNWFLLLTFTDFHQFPSTT